MSSDALLSAIDLIMGPVVFILLLCFVLLKRKKYTKRFPAVKKYFVPAFLLRVIGFILSALIYEYYYGYGDTFHYFRGGNTLISMLLDDFTLGLKTFISPVSSYTPEIIDYFVQTGTNWYTEKASSMIVIKIGALLGMITFKSYISIGLILSYFSFMGCWKIYEVFHDIYPQQFKGLAWGILFFPSLFFWGSAGLMKDTITLAATGYLFHGIYSLMLKKKFKVKYLFSICLSIYLIATIKLYIALVFIPFLLLWVFLKKVSTFRSRIVRLITRPVFLLFATVAGISFFVTVANSNPRYQLDNVFKIISGIQADFYRHGGTAFTLGEFDPSLQGFISMAPRAINAALFRPYIWEAQSIIGFLSASESLIILLVTLFVLLKVGIWKSIKQIFRSSDLIFCVGFSLSFAMIVGISAFNFGALVRYRILLLPFYFSALVLLMSTRNKSTKTIAAFDPHNANKAAAEKK